MTLNGCKTVYLQAAEIVWNFWNFYLEKYLLDFTGLYLVLTALPLLLKSEV